MTKKKKNKSEFKAIPPYAQIEQKLVDSEGFKNLKTHTKWLYVEFRLRYRGSNSRNITLTEKEAKEFMTPRTFRSDYKKLIEIGCIDLIEQGGFYNKKHIFGLSNRWKKFGTKEFIKVDIDKILPKIFKRK